MKIGIASPISVNSLKKYLDNVENKYIKLGLGGTSVNNIIIGLLKQGHDISVYTLDRNVKCNKPVILKGENLTIYIGQFRSFHRFNKFKYFDFLKFESDQIKKFILQDKPDIVNAHWSYEYAVGAIKSKYPHLITFRDDARTILKLLFNSYRIIRLLIDWWVRKNGEFFIVNSPYLQDKLSYWRKYIPIILNPFNPDIAIGTPKILSLKKVKIISILNGWGKIKNPEKGIKAFQLLKKCLADIHLEYHLYGPGYEENSLGHRWCVDNKLDEEIFFHGSLHHTQLMKELENYDILLHPSIEESFGNTIIEAMVKGIPVVAGKESGAVSWVLNYGKNGVLVDVSRPEEIAKGLKKLFDDKEYFMYLSTEGISYVQKNFSCERIANKYVQKYKTILNATN